MLPFVCLPLFGKHCIPWQSVGQHTSFLGQGLPLPHCPSVGGGMHLTTSGLIRWHDGSTNEFMNDSSITNTVAYRKLIAKFCQIKIISKILCK
jgi:hypothetical protein